MSTDDAAVESSRPAPEPALIFSLCAEAPLRSVLRHSLKGVESACLGREGAFEGRRDCEMAIPISDRFVSGAHARLQRVVGHWVIEDLDSKNGTFVDGVRVQRATLKPGAVIEIGHSFLVFRPGDGPRMEACGIETANHPYVTQLAALERIVGSAVSVVLRGETGTGKEVVARAVHSASGRAGSFVAINCGALAASLAESELFGYRKGAFSGALEDRPGLIRSADRGTLFLDEIGELPAPLQAALLRVLQESEVLPVGATRPVPVDFRLVVATHRDLEKMAQEGLFRTDLMARISGFSLAIPPLRERREDLGSLVAVLLRRTAPLHVDRLRFTLAAARALFLHSWPLNVRELEKALSMAAALSPDGLIELEHLPSSVLAQGPTSSAAEVLTESEKRNQDEIIRLLREHHGNVAAVARAMGKARMQVHRWMRRYGIEPDAFR